MSSILRKVSIVFAVAVLLAIAAPASAQFNYFPGDASTNDGRMVALAGDSIDTLAQDSLTFIVAVPSGVTQFNLGIFDGETGQTGTDGFRHWDNGTTQLQYALYYDPFMQGNSDPANLVGVWRGNETNPTSGPGWTASSATFPNNDWWNLTVDVPEPPEPLPGQAPSGATFYHLCVSYRAQTTSSGLADPCTGDARPADASPSTIANFKLRATANISVLSFAFAYEGALRFSNRDPRVIYPQWDGTTFPGLGDTFWLTTPTTYDGDWSFAIDVPTSQENVTLFGGDFDFGTGANLVASPSQVLLDPCVDTDDPDTSNAADFPPFAVDMGGVRIDDSLPEGARLTGGVPSDDNRFDPFRRTPCINWTLTSPGADGDIATAADNVTYVNANPSSQREWEQFRVSSEPTCDDSALCDPLLSNCADFCELSPLPAGIWQLNINGVDLSNLNAWRSTNVSGFCVNCGALPRPYLIGDTVFDDGDENGMQDAGESGIPGVLMELVDSNGQVLDTRLTGDPGSYGPGEWEACMERNTGADTPFDVDGLYCFDVSVPDNDPDSADSVSYTVRVAASNFVAGGALFDYFGEQPMASTASPEQTNDVDEGGGNVMTYDFGYFVEAPVTGSLGDRVWKDLDADGVQDGGEPGINGVTVELYDAGGNLIDSQVTAGDGEYLFTGLDAGTYTVVVDASTLPANLAQTYDLDGLASANQATADLGAGEERLDVDFGYTPCGECDGKISLLRFVYNGDQTAYVKVKAKKGSNWEWVFADYVSPGEVFEVVGSQSGNPGFRGTLGTEIKIYVNGHKKERIHTSCSVPIAPGDVYGDFEIVYAESKHGGALCPPGGCTSDCPGGECPDPLDFETDGNGDELHKGQIIDDEFAAYGLSITSHDQHRYPAMIFDTAHPTGGDYDLGTPNEDFGGPGRGNGGESGEPGENSQALGKVLIVSEDGHSHDPDDRQAGGKLYFTWDEPVDVHSLSVLDIDETGGYVKAYDADGDQVAYAPLEDLGNNSFQEIVLDAEGVTTLKVYFKKSGAVASIDFCPEDEGGGNEGGGEESQQGPGTGTIGYWKTHGDDWPVDELRIGEHVYPKSTLLWALWMPSRGDMTKILAQQLIAAKLNVEAGNESGCVDDTIDDADDYLEDHPWGSNPRGSAKAEGEALKNVLDDYNNGRLCAPHRD